MRPLQKARGKIVRWRSLSEESPTIQSASLCARGLFSSRTPLASRRPPPCRPLWSYTRRGLYHRTYHLGHWTRILTDAATPAARERQMDVCIPRKIARRPMRASAARPLAVISRTLVIHRCMCPRPRSSAFASPQGPSFSTSQIMQTAGKLQRPLSSSDQL